MIFPRFPKRSSSNDDALDQALNAWISDERHSERSEEPRSFRAHDREILRCADESRDRGYFPRQDCQNPLDEGAEVGHAVRQALVWASRNRRLRGAIRSAEDRAAEAAFAKQDPYPAPPALRRGRLRPIPSHHRLSVAERN